MSKAGKRAVMGGVDAVYHIVSRSSCRNPIFGDEDKEQFCAILRRQAFFSGVEVLAYCFMSDHFHLLVRVRFRDRIDDRELIDRYRVLANGGRPGPRAVDPDILENMLVNSGAHKKGEPLDAGAVARHDPKEWREKLTARMGDIVSFMRELKQRFGISYNQRHQNRGTLWSDRYDSLLVEPKSEAMATLAAYIDLNAVRAGLVENPADYRFCSYAAAIKRSPEARMGYCTVYGVSDWKYAVKLHRERMFGSESDTSNHSNTLLGRTQPERLERALNQGEYLTLQEALRCRVRYFTDGMALGSQEFLANLLAEHPRWFSKTRKPVFAKMKGSDWGNLRVVRNLTIDPIV